ncbi:helix-turn-helix transcriptional regulator [Roseibium aggregatum]|uniref:YafY family transcriptional regulator n=1 Tax=Roseibium aggregatum TaxID=187304 RepID=A0A926NRA4_9HYPH|nr:YafY family protein [Roseibium aggregatum]MBD1545907.1 YafY family transcriptional regulator [Roseibium aggregatum]
MRASRLLSILLTLQARGRVTARTLADEFEVSERTIYRDIDSLSEAGIPVYSERGSEGGYRLLDGYRTRLNGLSAQEADALFLTGLPGPAADLGLGAVMAGAKTKLLTALPEGLRRGAEQMQNRFLLDAPAWFAQAEQPDYLPEVARAVWDQRFIDIRYRAWKAEKRRRVAPLGIVLKSGSWYLAGAVDGSPRTYRISRILEFSLSDTHFERPADFDLAAYWRESTRRLEEELHPNRATLRLSPWGRKMFEAFLPPYVCAHAAFDDQPDDTGWTTVTLPVGSIRHSCTDLLRFGAEAEVLAPSDLRAAMAEIAEGLGEIYRQERVGNDAPSRQSRPRDAKPSSRDLESC